MAILHKFLTVCMIVQPSVLSVLGGQDWTHIPQIPAGRRAQYLLLKNDGGYKYGYDTGVGSSAQQAATGDNEVTGAYSFVGSDGQRTEVQYTSGVGGYMPVLGALHKSGPSATATSSTGFSSSGADEVKKSPASVSASSETGFSSTGEVKKAPASVSASSETAFSGSSGIAKPPATLSSSSETSFSNYGTNTLNAAPADASYSFSFNDGNYHRQESSDANANVVGSYQYTSDQLHNVHYIAGADTGFVANVGGVVYPSPVLLVPVEHQLVPVEHQLVPVDHQVPFVPYHVGPIIEPVFPPQSTVHTSFHQRVNHGFINSQNSVNNEAGVKTGVKITSGGSTFTKTDPAPPPPPPPPPPPTSTPRSDVKTDFIPTPAPLPEVDYSSDKSDASYSFSYETKDHARKESSDSNGNVQGSFSFIAPDDGVRRTVDYSAGSDTGFIAKGAHLPQPVVPQAHPSTGFTVPPLPVIPPQQAQPVFPQIPQKPYVPSVIDQAPVSPDGSYSFSYQTNDHSRTESSDSSGNVQGSYSFVSKDDGTSRRVDYTAGANTGFVAKGAHLPNSVPSLPEQKITPFVPGVKSPVPIPYSPSIPQQPFPPSASSHSDGPPDGSYSFSYQTNDQSRTETGDSSNNVIGSYSFVANDNLNRRVDYTAGADTGFVAILSQDPQPIEPQSVIPPVYPSISSKTGTDDSLGQEPLNEQTEIPPSFPSISSQTGTGNTYESGEDESSGSGDASYSYSYMTDTSSKTESSDSQGNVVGQFEFIGGDGVSRRVEYTATNKDGFLANGAHLPKPGVIGSTFGTDFNTQQKVPAVIGSTFGTDFNTQQKVPAVVGSTFETDFNTQQKVPITDASFIPRLPSHDTKTATYPAPNLVANNGKVSDFILHTYLSPTSEKLGYIYDTKTD